MSIRKQAVLWLENNFGERPTPLFTSKYYKPEESWPKKSVWWFHIPIKAIEENSFGHINLICEAVPNENKFHVPESGRIVA